MYAHFGHLTRSLWSFLTFNETFMTLFALLKLHFLKPLKRENLAARKISTFDFDHNFVILTMFPFNRYNFFL